MYCAEDILLLSIVKHFVRSIHTTLCLSSKQRLTQTICVVALPEGTDRANTIPYPQLIRDRLYERPIQIKFLTRSTRFSLNAYRLGFTPGYSSVSKCFTWQIRPYAVHGIKSSTGSKIPRGYPQLPARLNGFPVFFTGYPIRTWRGVVPFSFFHCISQVIQTHS